MQYLLHSFSSRLYGQSGYSFAYCLDLLILLKLVLNLVCMINVQGKELCLGDFIEKTFNMGLRSDAYGQICLKLA